VHSVAVLLQVHAKCIVVRDEAARLSIAAAFGPDADSGQGS
jgi:hypothetical protein